MAMVSSVLLCSAYFHFLCYLLSLEFIALLENIIYFCQISVKILSNMLLFSPFLSPFLLELQLRTSMIDLLTMFPYHPVFNTILSLIGRREWKPTPVFLPGESHGQRSLVGYSPWGCKQLERLSDSHTFLVLFQIFSSDLYSSSLFSL